MSRSATPRKLIREADPPAPEREIADKLAALDEYQRLIEGRYTDAQIEERIREVREERQASTKRMLERARRARR